MFTLSPTSNFANKVRNTKLPKTKPLLPLFELISNSIHAINEAKKEKLIDSGKIKIRLIRNGSEDILKQISDIDKYPIHSIEVIDNGIGLNDENLKYFIESDTDHKIEIGGKGVGRFVCLKAFKSLKIKSCFKAEKGKRIRQFDFKSTKEAFHNYSESEGEFNKSIGTSIILDDYRDEYKKHLPLDIIEIARAITIHFQ